MIRFWRKIFLLGANIIAIVMIIMLTLGLVNTVQFQNSNSEDLVSIDCKVNNQAEIAIEVKNTIEESQSQKLQPEAMAILFSALGLAGSVVPAVYNAGSRKIKGILVQDMTRYFFPHYGWLLVGNLIITLCGQICCAMDNTAGLLYFLIGALFSVAYATILILGTGLNQSTTEFFIKRYISDKIHTLKVTRSENSHQASYIQDKNDIQTERFDFLKALATHISEQTAEIETHFYMTRKTLLDEIRQVGKIITYQTAEYNQDLSSHPGFIDGFDLIFKFTDEPVDSIAICDNVYYELPASKEVRHEFSEQVEYAYEFWQIVLGNFDNIGKEAKTACRILYAMAFHNGKLCDNYLIIGSGLVLYLYKKYHHQNTDLASREVDKCAAFIDQMTCIFRGESWLSSNPKVKTNDILKLCGDLLYTVWIIALVEECASLEHNSAPHLNEAIDRLILGEDGYIAILSHTQDYTAKYLSLVWCLLKQLPSVANKVWTLERQRSLLAYVESELEFLPYGEVTYNERI